MVCKRCHDAVVLQLAKGGFAQSHKDVGNRLTCTCLNVVIGVAKANAELRRDQPTDRRLTCTGRANKHNNRCHVTAP
jgi:hypothetical protein